MRLRRASKRAGERIRWRDLIETRLSSTAGGRAGYGDFSEALAVSMSIALGPDALWRGMGDEKTGTRLSTPLKIASSNRSRMLLGRRSCRSSNGRRFREGEARLLVIRAGAEECSRAVVTG